MIIFGQFKGLVYMCMTVEMHDSGEGKYFISGTYNRKTMARSRLVYIGIVMVEMVGDHGSKHKF